MSKMSAEELVRLRAARDAKLAGIRAGRGKRLRVGGYVIYRFDEWNYKLEKDGEGEKDGGYYPSVEGALLGLSSRRISEGNLSSIRELLKSVDDLRKEIRGMGLGVVSG